MYSMTRIVELSLYGVKDFDGDSRDSGAEFHEGECFQFDGFDVLERKGCGYDR